MFFSYFKSAVPVSKIDYWSWSNTLRKLFVGAGNPCVVSFFTRIIIYDFKGLSGSQLNWLAVFQETSINLGPFVSSKTAQFFSGLYFLAAPRAARLLSWVWKSPSEKSILATFMPASSILTSISMSQHADLKCNNWQWKKCYKNILTQVCKWFWISLC